MADTVAITVDVEDWVQAYYCGFDITERVYNNTQKLLLLFSELDIKATFFVQGMVAEKFPQLVRDIMSNGHEVGVHSHSHRRYHDLSDNEVIDDIHKATAIIASITGTIPKGFRTPAFSMPTRTLTLYESLAKEGYIYDSSLYPLKMKRYGANSAYTEPHIVNTEFGNITELPLFASPVLPFSKFPISGGGYLRFFPYVFMSFYVKKLKSAVSTPVIYIHPYDIEPDDFVDIKYHIPLILRTSQLYGRKSINKKIEYLATKLKPVLF